MFMTHRTLLICSAVMASLVGGCAPGVESSGAPAAASKQAVVSEPSEEKGDPEPTSAECVQGTLEDYACFDIGNDEKDPTAGGMTAATAACDELGLTLSTTSMSAVDCAPHSARVSYVCCPAVPAGPVEPSCHQDKIWSDACNDLASLQTKATALCAESGDTLFAMVPLGGCSDNQAMGAEITCCPAVP